MKNTAPWGERVKHQAGAFLPGLVVGLLIGLAIALGVTLYVNKVPVPFVNKVPHRTADEDAAEAQKNRNWDPNAPLTGSSSKIRIPDQLSSTGPGAAVTPPPGVILPPPISPPAALPVAAAASKAAGAAPTADPGGSYYVQAGAFSLPDEAENQRARLAMMDLNAKVVEREQAGRMIYRVRLGPFEKRADADSAKVRLELEGIDAALVR